jgi:predicted DNA-binding WGR domain protein
MSDTSAYLTRIKPEVNCHRFYKVEIWPTLFGEYSLVREWGRLGRGGTLRTTAFTDFGLAAKQMQQLVSDKTRRGYQAQ